VSVVPQALTQTVTTVVQSESARFRLAIPDLPQFAMGHVLVCKCQIALVCVTPKTAWHFHYKAQTATTAPLWRGFATPQWEGPTVRK